METTFIIYFNNRKVSYVLWRNTETKIDKSQIKEESTGLITLLVDEKNRVD